MKRSLLPSAIFIRQARRVTGRDAKAAQQLEDALHLLSEDPFDPRLKTHKLKGKLTGFWACSGGYDLRILFKFVKQEKTEAILLLSVGTHDEVY